MNHDASSISSSLIALIEASSGGELPRFVNDGFDAFLECGILAPAAHRVDPVIPPCR